MCRWDRGLVSPDLGDEDWEDHGDPNADLDAAVINIPRHLAGNYKGVVLEDLDRLIHNSDPGWTAFMLIGYPGTHTEVDDEEREVSTRREPFLSAEVDPIVYSQQDVKLWKRLLLKRSTPPLNFASGGAIWQLTFHGTIRKPTARLVATFADAGDHFASGARIGIHLELARRSL